MEDVVLEEDPGAFGTDLSVHVEDCRAEALFTDAIGTLLAGVREEEKLVDPVTELRWEAQK